MSHSLQDRSGALLLPLVLVYGATSLLHFLHNAVYLTDYPNLPDWLTATRVLESWLVVAATGALGYLMYTRLSRFVGLTLICVYALLGCGGLDHYAVAPMSAHTAGMNATILLETGAALVLLAYVARCAFQLSVGPRQPAE
jgi:hypothetical protein